MRRLVALSVVLLSGCPDPILVAVPPDPGLIGVDLGDVAVITGDYDRIEELLSALEVDFLLYDGFILGPPAEAELAEQYAKGMPPVEDLLGAREVFLSFDVVFFNCGVRGTGNIDPVSVERDETLLRDREVLENLSTFLEYGGHLVFIDQSYTLLEAAFPGLIDFQGDDTVPGNALVGDQGVVTASVVRSEVREAIGTDRVSLEFEVGRWAVALEGKEPWLVADVPILMPDGVSRTTASGVPLLIQKPVANGSVTFTSFHNLPEVDQVRTDLQIQLLRSLRP